MFTHILSANTQAILLLCASFGQNRNTPPQPLNLKEYNTLADWLLEQNMTPADLLETTTQKDLIKINISSLDSNRLITLLERGLMLSLAVEKWTNQGLWILARSSSHYPKRLKNTLRHSAPPILYGVGNQQLLSQGGLGVVGSRDIDSHGIDYTKKVVQRCTQEGIQIISGGARGVDRVSMLETLAIGGNVVGVLADSLAKSAVASQYREAIKNKQLTLISPYDPEASFNIGNAMGRNKHIYGLADNALVISSSVNKGGTWSGAVEALNKIKDVSVFVRLEGDIPEGNQKLVDLGARVFPKIPWNKPLRELLVEILRANPAQKDSFIPQQTSLFSILDNVSEKVTKIQLDNFHNNEIVNPPKDIYEAVLPFILKHLQQPKNDKYLAESLDVQRGQVKSWLERAVTEGKIIKNQRPVTYVINS